MTVGFTRRAIRCFLRTPKRSAGFKVSGRSLSTLHEALPQTAQHRLSIPRQNYRGYRCGRICLGYEKSISVWSLPVEPWASRKYTTISGRSVLWSVIWDTLIWRLGCSNHSKIRSAQKCYLSLWYVVSPMCPGRTEVEWWAWVDLNHRPRPYQGRDNRFKAFRISMPF